MNVMRQWNIQPEGFPTVEELIGALTEAVATHKIPANNRVCGLMGVPPLLCIMETDPVEAVAEEGPRD